MQLTENSISPGSALIKIRTPERAGFDHGKCVMGGDMRNRGSIDPQISNRPYSAWNKYWPYFGQDLFQRVLVLGGRLRN